LTDKTERKPLEKGKTPPPKPTPSTEKTTHIPSGKGEAERNSGKKLLCPEKKSPQRKTPLT